MSEQWLLDRDPKTRVYRVGLLYRGWRGAGCCHWRKLKAKTRAAALREVPAALAELLIENAEILEEESARALALAAELRESAKAKVGR